MNIWTQLIAAKGRRFEATAKAFDKKIDKPQPSDTEVFRERMMSFLLEGLKDGVVQPEDLETVLEETFVAYIMES